LLPGTRCSGSSASCDLVRVLPGPTDRTFSPVAA
jgi:hypothetical protein